MKRGTTLRRLAWATDIHLNFVQGDVRGLREQLAGAGADGLIITGDISEAPTLKRDLAALDGALWLPTFIVLGNHDFYGGGVRAVRTLVMDVCRHSRWLRYLPAEGVVPLGADTALVGHDGWADGRLGDFEHSSIVLNDYLAIEDLAGLKPQARLERLHQLGDEAAAHFRRVLPPALDRFRSIVVATHVPPFREACWHEGKIANDEQLPHFGCGAAGQALLPMMRSRPEQRLLVLCGHTHSRGVAHILPNLEVKTGGATYGQPVLAEVIDTMAIGRE